MVSPTTLRQLPFFAAFSPSDLELLAGLLIERSFQPGELIFLEGEPSTGLWFVARGRVKLYRIASSGKEQILCLVGPQTCFGGCPVFDGDVYPATAQAVDQVTLYILPRAEALALAEQSPELARIMLRLFGTRLRHLSRVADGLAFQNVVGRLATFLVDYADQTGTPSAEGIQLHLDLTQEDLAALLGTARQMVSRAFLCLERQGAIRARRRRICILNIDRLRQLALKV